MVLFQNVSGGSFFSAWRLSWLEVGITGHNFGRGPSKDHSTKVWLQLAQWFLRRKCLCEFPIASYVKLSSAVGAILVEGTNRRTHFTGPIATKLWWNDPWMAPFQNCVRWSRLPTKIAAKLKIEKRGDEIFKNLLLWNYWANLNQTLLKWSLGGPLPKLCPTLRPRWPPQPNLA
jgi:hypothetical protein